MRDPARKVALSEPLVSMPPFRDLGPLGTSFPAAPARVSSFPGEPVDLTPVSALKKVPKVPRLIFPFYMSVPCRSLTSH